MKSVQVLFAKSNLKIRSQTIHFENCVAATLVMGIK